MKFSYKFNNILGSVYDKGNLVFFPNGTQLLSPCGNKVNIFDLINGRGSALPIEVQHNITCMALNPTASLLLIATEKAQLYMISMISEKILHRKDYKNIGQKIYDLQFSPDGKYYAVCGTSQINVYLTPGFAINGKGRVLSAFKIHQIIKPTYEESNSIAWNHSSQLLIITSKDYSIRIYPIDKNLTTITKPITLTAHNDIIIGAFFANDKLNPLNIYSIARTGQFFTWKSECSFNELISNTESIAEDEEAIKLNYKIEKKRYIFEELKDKDSLTRVSTYNYNCESKLMVIGFTNGAFMLYELPDSILIHSLQLSTKGPLTSISFNPNGQWIAIGSSVGTGTAHDVHTDVSTQTQLVVWEWQSESFILKQSGYSSSITNSYECIAYSPDASLIVTGGSDGRIKVWNMHSGFCLSTFATEHKGPVTGVEFAAGKNGKVFLSCSLDGTVKAFDLNRYRCFRTLAAPNESKPAQFICIAIDKIGGDFIAAGSHNFFEIFLWSLKTGRLLEILTGHEGPVSSIKFSPSNNTLYSCSWDNTARIWNLFEGPKCTREIIKLGADALDLAIRDDGNEFAIATLNGNISFFNSHSGEQIGVGIEGKDDLGSARYQRDIVKDKHKHFSTICYSADGEFLIAGGKSKFVCIYNVKEKLLMKKFEISHNLSLDGFQDFISKRKIKEFDFNLELVKHRETNDGMAPIALPGVMKSDYTDRELTPIISVYQIRFSPTMRAFSFVSTEGVLIYSLDKANIFDPFELDTSVTPIAMRRNLQMENYAEALMQSIKLNDKNFVREVVESTPINQINLIASTLPINYVEKLLQQMAHALETTTHIEFYMKWVTTLLSLHCTNLKANITGSGADSLSSTLRHLQQAITRHYNDLANICEHNKYTLRFVPLLAKHSTSQTNVNDDEMLVDDEEID